MPTLLDSYHDALPDSELVISSVYPATVRTSARGQCFKPSLSYKITSCEFQIKKVGTLTGTLKARLYLMNTGTYGNGGKPSTDEYPTITTPLAVSDEVNLNTLTTSYQYIEFTFSGDEQYEMTADTAYVITFMGESGASIDASNYIIHAGTLVSAHEGNGVLYFWDGSNARWGGYGSPNTRDRNFKVYGVAPIITTIKSLPPLVLEGWESTGEEYKKAIVDEDGIVSTV